MSSRLRCARTATGKMAFVLLRYICAHNVEVCRLLRTRNETSPVRSEMPPLAAAVPTHNQALQTAIVEAEFRDEVETCLYIAKDTSTSC